MTNDCIIAEGGCIGTGQTDSIESIPLTKEILKANGFKIENNQDVIFYPKERDVKKEIDNDYKQLKCDLFCGMSLPDFKLS